jgi:alpha-ketoglutarate-dependent taurine dioxygenase
MKISKIPGLGSFGHYIDDVDFNHITNEEWMEIGKLHLSGLVTILRNVTISKDQFLDRIRHFGPFKGNLRGYLNSKYGHDFDAINPETYADFTEQDRTYVEQKKYLLEETEGGNFLMRVTGKKDEQGHALGIFDSGELAWHSNESSLLTFTPGVALLGHAHMTDSSTGFVQTVDYYNSLTESFRSELDDMMLVHKYVPGSINPREIEDAGMRMNVQMGFVPVDGVTTPMVITSPGGHRGLHYTCNSKAGIEGMSDEESSRVFAEIDEHLFTEDYVYDHWYQQDNDLLLFDNSITLHRRLGGHPDRLAYRIQYDFSNLLDSPWYPYHQSEILEAYKKQTHELVHLLGIEKDFKLP